jgi:hypothetical protein
MVHSTFQHPPPPTVGPQSHTHTLSVYTVQCTFSLGRVGRGEEVSQREGTVEKQQYTSIVPLSMGATVHKLGRKYKPVYKIC